MSLFSKDKPLGWLAIALVTLLVPVASHSQTRKKPVKKPTGKTVVPAPTPEATVVPAVSKDPAKKNDRGSGGAVKTPDFTPSAIVGTRYSYAFDRPGFTYSRIEIEHDDNGKGSILMKHDKEGEAFTDPIQLSPTTVALLKQTFDALNFLDSTENYQHARDYTHMGNVTLALTRDGRSRTARFNWTDNIMARLLMDEYRRISNEYTWKFEMQSARENQPLSTPGLIDTIAGYVDRKEISDPAHLVPLLNELSQDERLPLMARNRIKKILTKIAKDSK
jgi:hypothetical protein